MIAAMTQALVNAHGIDPQRVFIAGLSAGGAMAAVVASAYPEIFAAGGVASGLPPGAATDIARSGNGKLESLRNLLLELLGVVLDSGGCRRHKIRIDRPVGAGTVVDSVEEAA